MRVMKLIKNQKGYTIVETLIVLAVTGVLFLTTTLLIQGQVEKNRYQDSMRQAQQTLQAAVKDTENGYFPGAVGTNSNMVFVGKRISYCGGNGAGVTDGCTDRTKLRIENLLVDQTTKAVSAANAEEITLPGGLTFIGSYTGTGQNKKTYTSGVVMQFGVIAKNHTFDEPVAAESTLQKVLKFAKATPIFTPAATGVVRGFADDDIGARIDVIYPLPGVVIDVDVEEAVSVSGCETSNVYCGAVTNVQQSVGIRQYDGNPSSGAIAFCFDGYRKGSLVIGEGGSSSVSLNLDDANCRTGF
jgi:prepilin-type N-terminal cleavage/methylation domain-containing protein